jgi:hypothetical protein
MEEKQLKSDLGRKHHFGASLKTKSNDENGFFWPY